MGIGPSGAGLLAEVSTRFQNAGEALTLGRQRFGALRTKLGHRMIAEHRPDLDPAALVQPDGYADRFIEVLGLGKTVSLDFSGYEKANILWDLNRPVPDDLKNRFGFVYDGGTLEHVFDVSTALKNVFHLLKPGGRFVAHTPLNNYCGHGFYQFGPELAYAFWNRMAGCIMHRCVAFDPQSTWATEMEDPEAAGARIEWRPVSRFSFRKMRFAKDRVPYRHLLMHYEVEKPASAALNENPQQSDYETTWQQKQSEMVPAERVGE